MLSRSKIMIYITYPVVNNTRGLKNFKPPIKYDFIQLPERPKLHYIERVPVYNSSIKPPKMFKRLDLMRGPELVHNKLIHKQYGIQATGGGRMKFVHFEVIRMGLLRKLDWSRMFAIWRIDSPWQSVTKKGQGQRMGGGKGSIDHYVTPIKSGRIIIEVSGHCEYIEIKDILSKISAKLPFKARAVSQEILEYDAAKEKWEEDNNKNPYTMEYLIKNNMDDLQRKVKRIDHFYFGKYV
ncbi:39S ribosomal protein L16, mitochondrial isoform X2 [Daktulosphaira vitifoliae]|uniref:39S ribosomal protein L16, mitochondrial isoform X2 n=1 Tax=Daktulosphaira vitifoliae TaxID=58002 RepID=UPI0021AA8FE0|nr:39S ribosomal protein L16, mitochondrial isoform X2 [Daktulosphaira vitifoliae]